MNQDQGYAQARQLYRVVRAMHDGVCPNCHTVHPAESMLKREFSKTQTPHGHLVGAVMMTGWQCPSCRFTVSREDGEAALQEFGKYIQGNITTWNSWLADRNAEATETEAKAEQHKPDPQLIPRPLQRYDQDVESVFTGVHRMEVCGLIKKVYEDTYVGHACLYVENTQFTWDNAAVGSYDEVRAKVLADCRLTSTELYSRLFGWAQPLVCNLDRSNLQPVEEPRKEEAPETLTTEWEGLSGFTNPELGESYVPFKAVLMQPDGEPDRNGDVWIPGMKMSPQVAAVLIEDSPGMSEEQKAAIQSQVIDWPQGAELVTPDQLFAKIQSMVAQVREPIKNVQTDRVAAEWDKFKQQLRNQPKIPPKVDETLLGPAKPTFDHFLKGVLRGAAAAEQISEEARNPTPLTKEQVEARIAQYLASPQFIGHVQTRPGSDGKSISVIGVYRQVCHMLQQHWGLKEWDVADVTGNLQDGFVVTVKARS